MVRCREGRVECKDEVTTRVEQVPGEACQFKTQEVCQQVEDFCWTIVRRICRRPMRRRRVCRRKNSEQKGGKG